MYHCPDINITQSSSVNHFIICDDSNTNCGVYFDHHEYITGRHIGSWEFHRRITSVLSPPVSYLLFSSLNNIFLKIITFNKTLAMITITVTEDLWI